jgi:hypothetical protein
VVVISGALRPFVLICLCCKNVGWTYDICSNDFRSNGISIANLLYWPYACRKLSRPSPIWKQVRLQTGS